MAATELLGRVPAIVVAALLADLLLGNNDNEEEGAGGVEVELEVVGLRNVVSASCR